MDRGMVRKMAVLLPITWAILLSGCISDVWTGVTLVYDRHTVYKQVSDFQLAAAIGRALYKDLLFKGKNCSIDYAVLNGDVLFAGFLPNEALREELKRRVKSIPGARRYFFELSIRAPSDNSIEDDWITAKIRSRIFADSSIDPKAFKIVTFDRVVYLMGDVFPAQADKVIFYARSCSGVHRVVKLFKYIALTDKPL